MALIKCPECGKEVSNVANACIHCGFPLTTNKSDKESSLKKVVIQSDSTNKLVAIKVVRLVTNLGLAEAKALVESDYPVVVNQVESNTANEIANKFILEGVEARVLDADNNLPIIEPKMQQRSTLSNMNNSPTKERNKITCPQCGSDDIHFVTTQASQNFDKKDACCGYLLCGPLGLLCGVKDKTESKTVRKCMKCNREF